jgi:type I restriction enzyme M protein
VRALSCHAAVAASMNPLPSTPKASSTEGQGGGESYTPSSIVYYDDPHTATGAFDFVLANPPFNVNAVDKERLKGMVGAGRRFPFGLPRTDNANTLWIQLFYSALNAKGRAGFVMANSASDARSSEQELRQKLIEARAVDVMVAVGPNMFYTVTLPCTLWFFDKSKSLPRPRGREGKGEGALAYRDIPGLCKAATLAEIKAQDWSLNPGRYVGVAPGEDVSDEDFKKQIETLNEELESLNAQALELQTRIAQDVASLLT